MNYKTNFKILLLILLFAVANSSQPALASNNLVNNPSMESIFIVQSPLGNVAEYWTGWGQGGGVFSEGSEAYNGDKSQEIRWDGDGWREFGPDGIYQQINSLQTGEVYWLSGWFKYEFLPMGMIADGDVEFSLGIDLNGGTDPDQIGIDNWVSYQHWGSGSFTVNWTYLAMAIEPADTTATVFVKAGGHGQAMEEMPPDPDCCCDYPPCDPPCDPGMCPPEYFDAWWESYLYIDNISVQLIQTASINATTGIPANGANYSVVTITVLDDNGLPVVGIPASEISINCTGSGNTITGPFDPTDENGQTTAQVKSTVAESKTVTATVLGTIVSNNIIVEFGDPYFGPIWHVDVTNFGYGNGSSEYPFKKISDSIIAAQNGDEVIVEPGTYYENIVFSGKLITIHSTNPNDIDIVRTTVIDANSKGPAVMFNNYENFDAVIDGFTLTGGTGSNNRGGGIYCKGYPTIKNNIISGNVANYGAGIYVYSSYNPKIINNIIVNNEGTGVLGCDGLIANCLIANNTGSGLSSCDATIVNCTIANNGSSGNGGGLSYCYANIQNCVIWGNSDEVDEYSQISGGSFTVTYSCIQDEDPNDADIPFGGSANGNIDDDPNFINGDSNSINVNYRLMPVSPCIDAADNTDVPSDVTMDLDGDSRFIDDPCVIDTGSGTPPIVDMGAYENPKNCFLLSNESIIVLEGATEMFTVKLLLPPSSPIQVGVGYHSGDTDISVSSGTVLTFDSSNYTIPQSVTIAAAEDADYFNSSALISVMAIDIPTAIVQTIEADNEPVPAVIYVDKTANGVSDGRNWSDAFTELRDALTIAADYSGIQEVRVAQGIYTPAIANGDRYATFQLVSNVELKGGYAGLSGTDPNARDFDLDETILSGDLNGDDNISGNDENSRSVVTGNGTDANAVFDGFTITAGNGSYGGGMHNTSGSPTVTNCLFKKNTAWFNGGAVYNKGSHPTFVDCVFRDNSTVNRGGGMANLDSSNPAVINCLFLNNTGGYAGGGMLNWDDSSPTVINCKFIGNIEENYGGGGVANRGVNSPVFVNCIFSGNVAWDSGGGMYNYSGSTPLLINCTFANNDRTYGTSGGGIYNESAAAPTIINCILWNNSNTSSPYESTQITGGSPAISYSCVEGWTGSLGGVGNFGDDPMLINPNGPDGIIGTKDDSLRLSWNSPCIDTGNNSVVPQDTNDIDDNGNTTEQIPWDLDQHARFADGDCNSTNIVDMGSYEFAYTNIGDFDNQCDVDFVDFAIFAPAWLTEDGDPGWNPDCDISVPTDDVINWSDLLIFVENWLAGAE